MGSNEKYNSPLTSLMYRLRCPVDVRLFVGVYAFLAFWYGMNGSYLGAVLTTIEKRFRFSGSNIGVIMSSFEFGRLPVLLLVSYFGNRGHIPRILGAANTGLSIASFLIVLPHFLYGPRDDGVGGGLYTNGNATSSSKSAYGELLLCDNRKDLETQMNTVTAILPEVEYKVKTHMGAMVILLISFITSGLSSTPLGTLAIAYLDDNSKKNKSPLYMGFVGMCLAFGPVIGYFMAAWCTSIYVDLSETTLTPEHPLWIGAWWLGILINTGCMAMMTPLLCLIPRSLNDSKHQKNEPVQSEEDHPLKKEVADEAESEDVYTCKAFPAAIWRTMKNPVYLCVVMGTVATSFILGGFGVFFPKYIENQFRFPAWKANTSAGVVKALVAGVSALVSGIVMTRWKVKYRSAIKLVLLCNTIVTTLGGVAMFVGCSNLSIAGLNHHNTSGIDLEMLCNSDCRCNLRSYSPVCDSGVTYFSPCHAGCDYYNSSLGNDSLTVTYTGCSCTESEQATEGDCEEECNMFIVYASLIVITSFTLGFTATPMFIITIRCVKESDKSLAFGLQTCVTSVLAWLPAPILYGYVIDSSCLVWQEHGGERGSCWIYDVDDLRYKYHGLTLCVLILKLSAFVCAFFLSRGRNFDDDDETDEIEVAAKPGNELKNHERSLTNLHKVQPGSWTELRVMTNGECKRTTLVESDCEGDL